MSDPRSHCRNCGKRYPSDADWDAPDGPHDAEICWDDDEDDCSEMDGWDRVEELRLELSRLRMALDDAVRAIDPHEHVASNRLMLVREALGARDEPYQTEVSAARGAMHRIGELEAEVARLTAERDDYASVALAGLSFIVATPERGYIKDGGPGLLPDDMRRMRADFERLTAECMGRTETR